MGWRTIMARLAVVRIAGLPVIELRWLECRGVVAGLAHRRGGEMIGGHANGTRRTRVAGDTIGRQVGVIGLGVGNPRCRVVAGIAVLAAQRRMIGGARHGIGHAGVMAIRAGLAGDAAVIHVDGKEGRRRMAGTAVVRSGGGRVTG